ncbi:unnamed protein product, partial [Sphacelaria rigidula]
MSDESDYSDYSSDETTSVKICLATIGLGAADLGGCSNLTEEFAIIKRAYFKKVLVVHPDKGGSAKEFRDVNESFELIRSLFEKKAVSSFATAAEATHERFNYGTSASASASSQPWQYYYDAPAEEVPPYRVELARSGRSKCSQKSMPARRCPPEDPFIAKDEIRVGSMDGMSGSYGRWVHLKCWRVPSRIWMGLPGDDDGDAGGFTDRTTQFRAALSSMNEVQFCGFNELTPYQQTQIVHYVMDKSNWARLTKRMDRSDSNPTSDRTAHTPPQDMGGGSATPGAVVSRNDGASSTALSVTNRDRGFFVVPSPGVNGAQPDSLRGKTIVLTGIFPEIGGGVGLNQGKDRVRQMCESFGARVTSAISGKTDLLIVGREPGASKVGKANASPKCRAISLMDLTKCIGGNQQLHLAPEPEIQSFSSGYNGNGLRALPPAPRYQAVMPAEAPQAPRAKTTKKPAPRAKATKRPTSKAKATKRNAPKAANKRTPPKATATKKATPKATRKTTPKATATKKNAPKARATKNTSGAKRAAAFKKSSTE